MRGVGINHVYGVFGGSAEVCSGVHGVREQVRDSKLSTQLSKVGKRCKDGAWRDVWG